jgi:asparagine synthase (glutamine-hydrolysing)
MPALGDLADQPFADDSALNSYLISKFVRAHVKVVLSGDGGDEQWGGYQNYRRYLQLRSWQRFLCGRALGGTVVSGNDLLGHLMGSPRRRLVDRVRFYGRLLATDHSDLYSDLDGLVNHAFLEELCGDRIRPYLKNGARRHLMFQDPTGDLDAIMLNDLQVFMVDDVLRKVDMMSMAVGLEVRVPLLDQRIVEKSVQLSWRDKVTRNETPPSAEVSAVATQFLRPPFARTWPMFAFALWAPDPG